MNDRRMAFTARQIALLTWERVKKLWREPALLVLLLLVSGSVWGFVELADEVQEGATLEFDRWAVLALRDADDPSDPVGPHWFEELMRDFTALGGVGVLVAVTIVVTGYLALERRWNMAALVATATIGGFILSSALKAGFDRPRPDLVPHHSHVYTRSFPSGHSMMAATTYLTLGVMLARLQRRMVLKVFFVAVPVILLLLVGASRVYLGVHWPTDVLAGWTAGAGWALVCWLTTILLGRKATAKAPPNDSAPTRSL